MAGLFPSSPSLPVSGNRRSHSANTSVQSAMGRMAAWIQLTKPRLAFASLLTAITAYAAVGGGHGPGHFFWTVAGLALSAGGAMAYNQWRERKWDAIMERTRKRPIPAGMVSGRAALIWSLLLASAGVICLAWKVNAVSAGLAALVILLYTEVYTPLKRSTRWATEAGAVPGALPPVLGAAAAGDAGHPAAWVLAAILLFWQMPHFYGIGWTIREDYRKAGFRLLPAIDPTGNSTAKWAMAYSLLLFAVSPVPWALGLFGPVYAIPAMAGALLMVWRSWIFLRHPGSRDTSARKLFLASLLHLPPVMAAILFECL